MNKKNYNETEVYIRKSVHVVCDLEPAEQKKKYVSFMMNDCICTARLLFIKRIVKAQSVTINSNVKCADLSWRLLVLLLLQYYYFF